MLEAQFVMTLAQGVCLLSAATTITRQGLHSFSTALAHTTMLETAWNGVTGAVPAVYFISIRHKNPYGMRRPLADVLLLSSTEC